LSICPDLKHNSPVNCARYLPDGKYLVSSSDDGIVKIWNAENGSLLQTLIGHTSAIKCISYSPDGQYLASVSWNNTVKIWEKGSKPQYKEVIWYLTKEISATESSLAVKDVTIEKAVISTKNQKIS
jgi:WD40 repeat protein